MKIVTKTGKMRSFSQTLTKLHWLVYYVFRHEFVRSRSGLLVFMYLYIF